MLQNLKLEIISHALLFMGMLKKINLNENSSHFLFIRVKALIYNK